MRWSRALLKSPFALAGVVFLLVFALAAVSAPWLGLPDPLAIDLDQRLAAPTWTGPLSPGAHPLGTDQLGRDMLSRLLHGGRATMLIAVLAVLLGGAAGVTLGIVAGFLGRMVDRVLMRIIDMQLAVPLMLLALLVAATLGPSLKNLVLVLSITSWVRYARIVRGQVLSLKRRDFVQSARAIGASKARMMFVHILPNVTTAALVVGTLELARVILLDASLSFLGLGLQPPAPSWGRMLADARVYIGTAWWAVVFPGLAIVFTVLSVNLVGDWLRDYFDPKLETGR